jgi:hypothetical protein
MKLAKDAFRRWKKKNWDLSLYTRDSEHFSMMGFDRPPLRRLWENHKASIITASKWLLALVSGTLILRLIGLG